MTLHRLVALLLQAIIVFPGARAQESTVYVSVLINKQFITGAANPQTGFFMQRPADDTTWRHAGPVNTRNFCVAPGPGSNGRVLYLATGPGVLKSTDGGARWRTTTDWRITEVMWVAPDPADSNTVYCATAYGIYKTSDGCRTWREMNKGLGSRYTQCMIIDHERHSRLYCVTDDGAYRSDDAGASWQRLGLHVGSVHFITQHPRDPHKLAVATENNGLYLTENGGRWWHKSEAGIEHETFYTVTYDPVAPEVMYAGGYQTGVYKSTDGGGNWKLMNNGLGCAKVHAVAVDPTDHNRLYAGTLWGGTYRSDDGAGSWRNVGQTGSQVYYLTILPY